MRETCSLCDDPAAETIISGCINQHLTTNHYCPLHIITWIDLFRTGQLHCHHCNNTIIEFDAINTTDIPPKT